MSPEDAPSEGDNFRVSAPAISVPKGGGAIRGIGEKLTANPVTGTGSLLVPISISPRRGGFGPQLALTYDSRHREWFLWSPDNEAAPGKSLRAAPT
jgi:virulence plasmid B protein